jgi:hypothetical protein
MGFGLTGKAFGRRMMLAGFGLVAGVLVFAPERLLGLAPPCVLRLVTGLNCPFCGMTRDFVAIAQGLPPVHNPASWFVFAGVFMLFPLLAAIYKFCSWAPALNRAAAERMILVVLGVMFILNNVGW